MSKYSNFHFRNATNQLIINNFQFKFLSQCQHTSYLHRIIRIVCSSLRKTTYELKTEQKNFQMTTGKQTMFKNDATIPMTMIKPYHRL